MRISTGGPNGGVPQGHRHLIVYARGILIVDPSLPSVGLPWYKYM